MWKRLLKGQEGYRVEDLDEPLDKEEEVQNYMVPGAESIGMPELDVLIKMSMPEEDLEKAEKEIRWQAMARMRAYKQSKGEEVESEIEMYEDLEPLLVQEVELEGEDIVMAGPSSAEASLIRHVFCIFLIML